MLHSSVAMNENSLHASNLKGAASIEAKANSEPRIVPEAVSTRSNK